MAVDHPPIQSNVFKAATAVFDFYNPSDALGGLLDLSLELLNCQRAALYELDERQGGFTPRFSAGIPLGDLGQIASTGDHPVLRKAINKRRASSTGSNNGSLGLPLAPGQIACAPCVAANQTIGLVFVARERGGAFDEHELATLEVLATRAAEILAFARQMANQNYLLHRLTLLYQASHAITATKDKHAAIRQTAVHLLKATSADICDVILLEDGEQVGTRFRQRVSGAFQQSLEETLLDHLPSYEVHREVLVRMRPATLSVVPPAGSAKDIATLQSEGLAAAAIFPLATRNQALGLVRLLYESQGRQIQEQELELAQAIINIGVVGIQDATHLQEAEARANELQVLANIGRDMTSTLDLEVALENTMRYTQHLLQCEACVLFMLDESGEKLVLKASGGRTLRIRDVAIRLEEGIAGWVARNQRPLIANDVRTNPLYHSAIDSQTGLLTSSVLCVPLETRGEVLGVLEAINHPRGAFSESDQALLSSVASWAAIALDNANLFRQVAEERSRLEATLVETADAVVLTDPSGRIILVNKAAAQAFRINADLAKDRPAQEVFASHPLGDLLTDPEIKLPTSTEISTPTDRVLYATISEVKDVGRVAVMQDITALKQIDRMRSQLLGTAAHDLKNPLNAIRLGADLLSDAPLSDQQRKALQMMQRATDSMTNLITGLLETIRVESASSLDLKPVDLAELIAQAVEDLRPLAESKGHTVKYEPPSEPLTLKGDRGRLKSVVTNLLSNAIKFTQPGGHIAIKVEWDDDQVWVHVEDDGPGIPEDEIPRVFDHLFRGRVTVSDPNNPIEGTGLGLALTKTVVEQHGGRIWVTSKEGEGSTFHFTLPWEVTPKTGSLRARKS